MPKDYKYGNVTLENQRNIGDDEPVFIFRAKDRFLPQVLKIYRRICALGGSPENHLDAIDESRRRIEQWQSWNETKIPDSVGVEPCFESDESKLLSDLKREQWVNKTPMDIVVEFALIRGDLSTENGRRAMADAIQIKIDGAKGVS